MELFELSAVQAADQIRRKKLSPVDLVEALLRRIDALEPTIQAWETVDRDGAMAAAHRCEQEVGRAERGLLHGIPLGVKDIYYTAGLPNTNGSPIFRDFVPTYDATSVARLRAAGAIVLGKTVTVQFAHRDPPRTCNPWNQAKTPGGSSSGSAAAVAARMVPVALGTQTGGSIVRPAAYCGAVGLKPTYGRVSRHGVTPASWSMDHIGPITRTVEDAALLLQLMAGPDPLDPSSLGRPVGAYIEAARRKENPPRLGLAVDLLEAAHPEVAGHLKEMATRFESEGARIREVRLPAPLPELAAIRNVIVQVESASAHARLHREHASVYSPVIRGHVEVGQLIPGTAYVQAQRLRRRYRPQMEEMFGETDCLLMPSTYSVAPDASTTGEGAFQAVWSLFGFPSITLPSGLSAERLPNAVQLVAPPLEEETLLSAAAWCETVLGPMPAPC